MMNAIRRVAEIKKSPLFSTSDLKQLAIVCIHLLINMND
jgi:hypothetical protein